MNNNVIDIVKNIEDIKYKMSLAAAKAGRRPEDVLLLAVTKTRSPKEVFEVVKAGIFDLGENKVQEYVGKCEEVQHLVDEAGKNHNMRWHLIGHLQRNKVKYIINNVHMIHSLDSYKLAEEISSKATAANRDAINVLVQINSANEDQKSGIAFTECDEFIASIVNDFKNIRVRGLMAVVPAVENPEEVRGYFKETKKIFDRLQSKYEKILSFDSLSMGMTNDYEIAIEEGSNIVRVGTAIFGPREYNKLTEKLV